MVLDRLPRQSRSLGAVTTKTLGPPDPLPEGEAFSLCCQRCAAGGILPYSRTVLLCFTRDVLVDIELCAITRGLVEWGRCSASDTAQPGREASPVTAPLRTIRGARPRHDHDAPVINSCGCSPTAQRWCTELGRMRVRWESRTTKAPHLPRTADQHDQATLRIRFPVAGQSAGLLGAPGRIRTCDLEIRSLLLYPSELRGLERHRARAHGACRVAPSRLTVPLALRRTHTGAVAETVSNGKPIIIPSG